MCPKKSPPSVLGVSSRTGDTEGLYERSILPLSGMAMSCACVCSCGVAVLSSVGQKSGRPASGTGSSSSSSSSSESPYSLVDNRARKRDMTHKQASGTGE